MDDVNPQQGGCCPNPQATMRHQIAFDKAALDRPIYLFYPEMDVQEYAGTPDAQLGDIELTSPEAGAVVQLLRPRQHQYVKMPREERMASMPLRNFRTWLVGERQDTHEVMLRFRSKVPAAKVTRVVIAEHPDFHHAVAVRVSSYSPDRVQIRNLKMATTYYWKVQVESSKGLFESPVSSFSTEDQAPRILDAGGMANFRDLGGRKGLGGKRVKQGLIYRTRGLNSNASKIYEEPEKVLVLYPEIKERVEQYRKDIAAMEAELANPPMIKYVSFSMGMDWKAFFPAQKLTDGECHQFVAFPENGNEFLGAVGQTLTATEQGTVTLGAPSEFKPGFLVNALEAESDGYVRLGCSGDWFWYLAVNGRMVYDCSKSGNGHSFTMGNNILEVPVKAGKNILTVMVKSGSLGFTWCCNPNPDPMSHADILTMRIEDMKRQSQVELQVVKELQPGDDFLDDAMTEYMTKTLGIKTDLDLRSDGECFGMTGSPLGPGVEWIFQPLFPYEAFGKKIGLDAMKKIFGIFLDESKYPIDFHCIGGQDRTGSLAFVLNALLGVDLDELYLDWEVTAFYHRNVEANHKMMFSRLVEVFEQLPGKTICEKAEAYLLALGYTQEDFEKFRTIMLE